MDAFRRGVGRIAALGAVLAGGLATGTVAGTTQSAVAVTPAPTSLADAQFLVGPAERVLGPTSRLDSNFVSLPAVNGTMRGYLANINTFALHGPDLEHLTADLTNPVVRYGADRSMFDHCGAWLQALWQDPANTSHVRGWYHAETDCHLEPTQRTAWYPSGTVLRSIGEVESQDGGRTFTKVGQAFASASAPIDGTTIGEGNPTAVVKDGFLYLPFTEKTTQQLVSMARAPLANVVGPFGKYDGSGWSRAPIGALGEPVSNFGGGTGSGLYTVGDQIVTVSSEPTKGGIRLRYGGPTAFTTIGAPLVPSAGSADTRDWTSISDTTKQMFAYPAIAAETGGNSFGANFQLLYMYLQPGGVLATDRYLVRRSITVVPRTAGDPTSLIALTRYRSASDQTATTSLPPSGYAEADRLGYVLTQADAGTVPLLDCVERGDQFVATSACPSGSTMVRTTGYLWSAPTTGAQALYSCASTGDRFASADPGCGGAAQTGILGYFRASPAAAPQVSVGGEVHDTTSDSDLSTAPPLAGAHVGLLGPDGTSPARTVDGAQVTPVTTGADGNYSFGSLPILVAGQHYTVVIDSLPSGQEVTPADHRLTSSLLTADGDAQTGIDFGVGPASGASNPVITFSSPARYGVATTITVTKAGALDGEQISLQVGAAAPVSLPLSGGRVQLNLPATRFAGTYPVTATYASTSATASLVIAKAVARITESFPTRTAVGGRASGAVTLTIPGTSIVPTGHVEITLGTKVVVAWRTLSSGRLAVSLPRLAKGTWPLVIRYAGTTNVSAGTLRFTLTQR